MRADYHVHTEFSDDSDYPLEQVCADACRLGISEICITDHVDYGIKPDVSPLDAAGTLFDSSYVDDVEQVPIASYGERPINVDYQRYFPALREARERWGSEAHDWWAGSVTVKCGLELGVQRHTIEANARLVAARRSELDFTLLSCHQIDDLEFWTGDYQRGKTPAQVTQNYYEEILACVEGFDDYCCLAHLDAIRRDNKDDQRPFEAWRDVVAAVLERVIADGKGIELNTSSVRYDVPDWQPSRDILALYRDLGGRIVTVGSDSHRPEHLGSYLTQAYDLLESLGFPGVCTYSHFEPELHPFSTLG
jgi:histidinol-phosphatase (PHP family)